jgi:hypothetical protein
MCASDFSIFIPGCPNSKRLLSHVLGKIWGPHPTHLRAEKSWSRSSVCDLPKPSPVSTGCIYYLHHLPSKSWNCTMQPPWCFIVYQLSYLSLPSRIWMFNHIPKLTGVIAILISSFFIPTAPQAGVQQAVPRPPLDFACCLTFGLCGLFCFSILDLRGTVWLSLTLTG